MENQERNNRRVRTGVVVSNKMDKTVVVAMEENKRHPLYGKVYKSTKKYKAHDENNQCNIGDTVEITETRPLSKDKHFRVSRIIERAK
jgi:small subunit ribosomal protein S17